jgi:hypothetical protein
MVDSRYEKIKYKKAICKKTGKCNRCPMHAVENGDGIYKKYGTRPSTSKNRHKNAKS